MSNLNQQHRASSRSFPLPSSLLITGLLAGCFLLGTPLAAFAVSTSPTSLAFSGAPGAANPPSQGLIFWKSGDRNKSWTASTSTPWVSVSPASGTIASEQDQITVTVNTSGLATGTYTTSVMITTSGRRGGISKTAVPVSLTIAGPVLTPSVKLTPALLGFSGIAGGTNPAAQTISLTNPGGGTLSWSMSDNATWLTLSTTTGITTTETDTVSANVSLAGLTPGTYQASITVTASGAANSPQVIPVSLAVTAAPTVSPAIGLSTTNLTYAGTAGGPNPSNQSFMISNTGGGTLTWTASDSAAWLTLSPASGTNTGTIIASVNLSGLAAGTYNSTITVAATGATTKTIPVSLSVTAASTGAPFTVSPPSMSYNAPAGGPNQKASIVITNTSTSTLTVVWNDNISWLVETSGDRVTIPPGGSAAITHTASTYGLKAGTYSGTATVTGSGLTNNIPVMFAITASTTSPVIGFNPASLTFTGTAGGANPTNQSFTISNTGGGTLTWTASDSAAWLTLSPASGTNTGTVTASINLTGLTAGTYSGTITVAATGAASKTLPVTLTIGTTNTSTTKVSSVTLNWGANTEPDLAGYKIYVGTQSGSYGAPIVLGKANTYQLSNLAIGTTYFFSVTAYDSAGNESPYSAEVSKSIF